MEFKGTKGKWSLSEVKTNGRLMIDLGELKGYIDVWYYDGDTIIKQEAEANAKLIASAPEMFELLKMIYLSFGGGRVITFSDKDIEDIEQLLTKITTL